MKSNEFVFTQPTALHSFGKLASEDRALVHNITLRIVGRYYDDESYLMNQGMYSPRIQELIIRVEERSPVLSSTLRGLQSYCWRQLTDNLVELVDSSSNKLFPKLRDMKIDFVNFCQDLPNPGAGLRNTTRALLGHSLDNLLITGLGYPIKSSVATFCLHNLVKDGGLCGTASPGFVHNGDHLEELELDYLVLTLVSYRSQIPNLDSEETPGRFIYKDVPVPFIGYDHVRCEIMKFHAATGRCLDIYEESEEDYDEEAESNYRLQIDQYLEQADLELDSSDAEDDDEDLDMETSDEEDLDENLDMETSDEEDIDENLDMET